MIFPITMNVVNWKPFIMAAKREGKDVTATLDRTGTPLHLPSSFVTALSELSGQGHAPANCDRCLRHLHFGFYYSLDVATILRMITWSDLDVTDFDGCGIVSGNFLQWREFIAKIINDEPELAIGFYRFFERAGLDRFFNKDTKDDIRKKGQVASR